MLAPLKLVLPIATTGLWLAQASCTCLAILSDYSAHSDWDDAERWAQGGDWEIDWSSIYHGEGDDASIYCRVWVPGQECNDKEAHGQHFND